MSTEIAVRAARWSVSTRCWRVRRFGELTHRMTYEEACEVAAEWERHGVTASVVADR